MYTTLKRTTTAAGTVCLLVTGACGERQLPTGPGHDERADDIETLVAAGFPRDRIQAYGDRYVIDGDIIVEAADLSPRGRAGKDRPSFQWYASNNRVTLYTTVSVYLGNLGTNQWAQGFRSAMAAWNAVNGTSLTFVETTYTAGANVIVRFGSCSTSSAIACANYPSGGKPGANVWVTPAYQNLFTLAQKTRTAAHELGHTVALVHTDWRFNSGESPPSPLQVPGTPASDQASVMNCCQGGTAFAGFTAGDQRAVVYLFRPQTEVTITYPNAHPRLSWGALAEAIRYRVVYYEAGWYYDDNYQQVNFENTYPVATTTATVVSDPYRWYTGVSSCSDPYLFNSQVSTAYFVYADFPGGSSRRIVASLTCGG